MTVAPELSVAAIVLIAAAMIAAMRRPETPGGSLLTMNHGNTWSGVVPAGITPGLARLNIQSSVPISVKRSVMPEYIQDEVQIDVRAALRSFAAA